MPALLHAVVPREVDFGGVVDVIVDIVTSTTCRTFVFRLPLTTAFSAKSNIRLFDQVPLEVVEVACLSVVRLDLVEESLRCWKEGLFCP